ncbi:hypothetical protein L249_1332, partial [Ophiocordyceps polyrhachis-furcata BCC 54312]
MRLRQLPVEGLIGRQVNDDAAWAGADAAPGKAGITHRNTPYLALGTANGESLVLYFASLAFLTLFDFHLACCIHLYLLGQPIKSWAAELVVVLLLASRLRQYVVGMVYRQRPELETSVPARESQSMYECVRNFYETPCLRLVEEDEVEVKERAVGRHNAHTDNKIRHAKAQLPAKPLSGYMWRNSYSG